MPSSKDLSKAKTSYKASLRFPAGNYIVVIDSYEMLPFSEEKSGTYGLAYVPKLKAISSLEADDDNNPEMQERMQAELDEFGDWTNKVHEFAYTNRETNTRMASVAECNFPLIETDEDHEVAVGILKEFAWRFYMNEDGFESGFVVDVLGLSFEEGTEIELMAEATVGKKFMVNFGYEPNQDASRPPDFVIDGMYAV